MVRSACLVTPRSLPTEVTGQALLDEDFLKAEGVTDFSAYACVPGTNPPRIPWFMV